jgi:DNA polymerase I-like protein with 3'-5' exonuclease and polymerase domains
LSKLREAWPSLKDAVIAEANAKFGFWETTKHGTVFKMSKFVEWLERRRMIWPKFTESGQPSLSKEVLEDMAKIDAAIAEFKDARHVRNHLRLENLACNQHGRNRVNTWAFGTKTGRNAQKLGAYIFGPAKWLRHLIVAPPGRALIYCDWSSQESGIQAALSGDPLLIDDYMSGDPYLGMAIRLGQAPVGATKATHGEVRDRFKVISLATSYGMGPRTLAVKLQTALEPALEILRLHHVRYPRYWQWSSRMVHTARLQGRIWTSLGWSMQVTPAVTSTTLMNFPVQACAADMMRLALVDLIEDGIEIDSIVHDAYLIECPMADLDRTIDRAREIMADASETVLRGVLRLRTDATVVRPGERYQEPKGRAMWDRIMRLLGCDT